MVLVPSRGARPRHDDHPVITRVRVYADAGEHFRWTAYAANSEALTVKLVEQT